MRQAALGGQAEVELSKIAQKKASNDVGARVWRIAWWRCIRSPTSSCRIPGAA